MSYEFKSTSYEFKLTSCEFRFTSYEFKSTSYLLRSTSYELKSTSYAIKSTSSRIIKSMKTYANSLKRSLFPKIISPKLFSNSWGNLLFYVTTTQWLQLKQEAVWVSINFERRDLNSHRNDPSPNDFGEICFSFAFNFTKQNATDFSFVSLTQNSVQCL